MQALMTSISQNLQTPGKDGKERKSATIGERTSAKPNIAPFHKTVSFEKGTKFNEKVSSEVGLDFDKFYKIFMELYGNKGTVDKITQGVVKETVIKFKESLKEIDLTDAKGGKNNFYKKY